jgi:hypothetical protein
MNVVLPEELVHIGRLRDDTVRLIKENVPIGRLNVGVENEE